MTTVIQNFIKVISTICLLGIAGAFTYSLREMELPTERGLCFAVATTQLLGVVAIWYG